MRSLTFLPILAIALVLSPLSRPAAADEERDVKLALSKQGVFVSSVGLGLKSESDLSKGMRDVAKVRKVLEGAEEEQTALEQKLEQNKKGIGALTQINVKLNAQLTALNPTQIALNNKLVGAINANVGRIQLVQQQNEQILEQIKESRTKAVGAREDYIQAVLDLRALADKIAAEYQAKAADPEVQSLLGRLAAATGKEYELTRSRGYEANLRRLKDLEDSVLSEKIPLRKEGRTLWASTVVGDKHRVEMVVDSGANLISLPLQVAAQIGVTPTADDPAILLQLADGRTIQGRRVTIPSLRVGKFTVENVEAAVLGPEAVNAEPLLGMTFLGAFKFEIDAQEGTLTMVKVQTE